MPSPWLCTAAAAVADAGTRGHKPDRTDACHQPKSELSANPARDLLDGTGASRNQVTFHHVFSHPTRRAGMLC